MSSTIRVSSCYNNVKMNNIVKRMISSSRSYAIRPKKQGLWKHSTSIGSRETQQQQLSTMASSSSTSIYGSTISSSSSSSLSKMSLWMNPCYRTLINDGISHSLRSFSSSSPYDNDPLHSTTIPYISKYEYPLATEPPIITRTKASDHIKQDHHDRFVAIYDKIKKQQQKQGYSVHDPDSVVVNDINESLSLVETQDPFDDTNRFNVNERNDILKGQKLYLNTNPKGTTPITEHVPSYIPQVDTEEQISAHKKLLYDVPTIESTTLSNGIRIVSQNIVGSQVSAVGVVCELGSRTEKMNVNNGVCNVLEMLKFNSNTKEYTGQQITQLLLDLGGSRFGNIGREQSLFCIDILRHNVHHAVTLLEQVLNQYQYNDNEIEEILNTLQYSYENIPPDLLLSEAIQTAAYGIDQQLGKNHYNTNIDSMFHNVNVNTCNQYWKQQFTHNPKGIVIGGIGIEHQYLLELVDKSTSFASFQQNDTDRILIKPSIYRGGEYRYQLPEPIDNVGGDDNASSLSMPLSITMEEQNMVKVAIAFEVCGWHHHMKHADNDELKNDLVTICVLQTLLGGGSSFSAGGPGKGMYSRLYRQILNRYHWVESCEAFTTFYNESGLFGIVGTTSPNHIDDMTHVITEHIIRLTNELVSDEELNRAKNMLKNNVLTQLESRLVLFEDISRQVLTYGQREDIQYTITKIQNVTSNDIRKLCQRMIMNSKQPTIACIGKDISNVPKLSTIQKWFDMK